MNRSSVIFSKAVVPDGVFSPLSNLPSGTTLKLSEIFCDWPEANFGSLQVFRIVPGGNSRRKLSEICCDWPEAGLVASKFSRMFWGEQPPFTPIACGGRYFFDHEINDQGTTEE